jgi:hypothetical protein
MQTMAAMMDGQFEQRMTDHLRATFPDETRGHTDGELAARIRDGIASAGRHGVLGESDVQRYLEYTLIYGADFDRTVPWAARILATEGVSGSKKMEWIDAHDQFGVDRDDPG